MHALAPGDELAGDPAAAELPAPRRRPAVRAAGRGHRHHRGGRDGPGAARASVPTTRWCTSAAAASGWRTSTSWPSCTVTGWCVHVDAEGSPLDVARAGALGRPHPLGGTELYMCGPIRLMDAVRRELGGRRAAAGQPALRDLRQQRLVPAGGVRGQRSRSDRCETTVRTDETLLEALTRAGVDLMYDCRKGECGLCLLDVDARRRRPRPPRRLPQRRPEGRRTDDLDVRLPGRRPTGEPTPTLSP